MVWFGTGRRRVCSFFSALWIVGPLFGQIEPAVEQDFHFRRGVTEVDSDRAVFHFAAVSVVLPGDGGGVRTAFGRSRLINGADRLRVSMVADDGLLALIPQ